MFSEEYIKDFRRDIHRNAESAWKEVRTTAKIAESLSRLSHIELRLGPEAIDENVASNDAGLSARERRESCERAVMQGAREDIVKRSGGYPGVVAVCDTGRPGPVTAFRFDMDALPYREVCREDSPAKLCGYASRTDSVHACGHDGHTAIGVGLAALLDDSVQSLCGKVILLFQPSEEAYFGAASMIAKGWLEGADNFISMHIALSAEGRPMGSHSFACGCSDFMSFSKLDAEFKGKAAHPCGASQEGRNALLAACAASLGIHGIAPHEKGLTRVNVGVLRAGNVTNTVPDSAHMEIEYRSSFPEGTDYLRDRIDALLSGAASMYGAELSVKDYGTSPAAESDPELMAVAGKAARKIEWFERIYEYGSVGGSDDAAEMIAAVQSHGGRGIYMGLGADTADALHGSAFDFDENVMAPSSQLCMEMVRMLNGRDSCDSAVSRDAAEDICDEA